MELDGDTVDKKFMDEVVRLLALGDKLNNMPNNLSGGQQTMAANSPCSMERVTPSSAFVRFGPVVPVLNVYENIVLPVELDGDTVDKKFMDEVVRLLALGDKLRVTPSSAFVMFGSAP